MSGEAIWALGLMSGTSMDGVDGALIRTDGETVAAFGPTLFRPYRDGERAVLRRAMNDAADLKHRALRLGAMGEAERVVTDVHGEVVTDLMLRARAEGIVPAVIGFHGQTVRHAPELGVTVQLGDGERLARSAGVPVVYDFRAADVAAGGQGAPLVPVFHRALAVAAGLALPAAIVNIGGVANVTLIDGDGLIAFDTGPGNALIDDLMAARTGARFDRGGAVAAMGRVDEGRLATLLAHRYFALPAPKSLDRDAFSRASVDGLSVEDAAATLTAFTAETIAMGLRAAAAPVATVVVAGGGAHNQTLMAMLSARSGVAAVAADAVGLDGDFVEAQAFAYLAVRRLRELPATYPGTTGVAAPVVGGVISSPAVATPGPTLSRHRQV